MKLFFHKSFDKEYQKLTSKQKEKVEKCLGIFLENPFDLRLNNHPLKGKYVDYRSINITGDMRAIYKRRSENECIFILMGTHSSLYH